MNGYIGVDNIAKHIKTMYIGIDGLARKVKKAYIGDSNGLARQWYSSEPQPSTEYESKSLSTWSSTTDVDNFFNAHNVNNGFEGIKIGNYVTIRDGTYNKQWVVAGFTCEHNATASDGTTYDNGVGMLMIPKTYIDSDRKWGSANNPYPYMNSSIHKSTLVTVANNLKNILGDHLIQRNVLLGSECITGEVSSRQGTTINYQWTTSYLTLPSVGQCIGTFASHTNKYDDGEANYKLPLFDYENCGCPYGNVWTRCTKGRNMSYSYFEVWVINSAGNVNSNDQTSKKYMRPLMLLR